MSFYQRRQAFWPESTAPSVAALFDRPHHAGGLDRATRRGRAVDEGRRIVDLGLWLDASGRVSAARWKASTCVSLMACAERACQLLEAGVPPGAIDAARLIEEVRGLHPMHHARAWLVAEALQAALAPHPSA